MARARSVFPAPLGASRREFAGRAGLVFRRQVAVDGEIVEKDPGEAAGERGDDRDPEVTAVRLEDGRPPAQEGRGEPRAEVARRVDGIAGQAAERQADRPDQGAQRQRLDVSAGGRVASIGQGPDAQQQDRGGQEFAEEVAARACRTPGRSRTPRPRRPPGRRACRRPSPHGSTCSSSSKDRNASA